MNRRKGTEKNSILRIRTSHETNTYLQGPVRHRIIPYYIPIKLCLHHIGDCLSTFSAALIIGQSSCTCCNFTLLRVSFPLSTSLLYPSCHSLFPSLVTSSSHIFSTLSVVVFSMYNLIAISIYSTYLQYSQLSGSEGTRFLSRFILEFHRSFGEHQHG